MSVCLSVDGEIGDGNDSPDDVCYTMKSSLNWLLVGRESFCGLS